MRTILMGGALAVALVLPLAAGAAMAQAGGPGATNWDGQGAVAGSTQTYSHGTGTTTTTTTTTTTIYPPTVPATGYTPYSPSEHGYPDQGRDGSSPRASQMPTGSHCPPGTPDCAGANR